MLAMSADQSRPHFTSALPLLSGFVRPIRMKWLCGLLLLTMAYGMSMAQSQPEEVVFRSGGRELHGFLWKPEGVGPFAAIVWNHGSEKLPGSQPVLAKFYTAHSYVFF